jgi:hypothetical protein
MDLLTLFFIALVVLALVWFTSGKKSDAAKETLKTDGKYEYGYGTYGLGQYGIYGQGEYGELEEVGEDISEAY